MTQVVDTIAGFRKALDAERAAGRTVGLVPTMGALHDGHASLIDAAARACDVVAVTVFVNPLQFGPHEDLSKYPRPFGADVALASAHGASYVFAPAVEEMYPGGVLTSVTVAEVSEGMEGAARPGHFDGVTTVVAKLFNAAGPCTAFFGEKDWQQLQVVRRMTADLSFPVEVIGCATVRAADGLALSSRNVYLDAGNRSAAPVLYSALTAAAALAESGERDLRILRAAIERVVATQPARPPRLRRSRSHRHRDPLARCCPPGPRPPHRQPRSDALMRRRMMKSKIHRATVSDANLNYVGSITLDTRLMELADIREWEQVVVVDINNGARFETYAIPGGPGDVCLNGAAARLVHPGDLVIVISYADYEEAELTSFNPLVVHVDEANHPVPHVDLELAAD